jgi:glycosyltransferase involved in cell wall biosynthesis
MQLSICIPTYNRVKYLREITGSIISQITRYGLHDEVELVVSNNNSTDETAAYLSGLAKQYPDISFGINHNQENVGFVRNLLKTVQTAHAKYWWFIGDDDAIPDGVLPLMVEELKQNPRTPVFIFNQKGEKKITSNENISIQQCAGNYYYYMGNAVTVCDVQLSLKVINECYDDAVKTCWPQTYLFFMSMYFSKESKPVRTSTVEAFWFNVQNNMNASS